MRNITDEEEYLDTLWKFPNITILTGSFQAQILLLIGQANNIFK